MNIAPSLPDGGASGGDVPSPAPSLADLRVVTTDQIRVHGYSVAYCPRCGCRKTVNGSPDWPNVHDEGCSRDTCRCHHNHDRGCYGTGKYEDERLCGFDA